jgi:Fic family protein
MRQAEAAKTHDAWHSTTIEGYRITPEEVSAVIGGRQVGGHDPEDVKARMAVKGYSAAFDRCIAIINESDGGLDLSESLIQSLYLGFVAVHPFPDGNGRIARFLMNLCLMTAGVPWVTIRSDDRMRYFEALEAATVGQDATS